MHTRGRPEDWRTQAQLPPDELVATVRTGLQASLGKAVDAGISPDAIVLDPGYGFGKRGEENFALLSGVSRKSFLGRALSPLYGNKIAPVEARETASVAALVAAILHGASVVRVHSIRAAVEAALVADQVQG